MNTVIKLSPAFKDYIWGGTALKAEYGITDMERVAEAWVLSAHPDGPSRLPDGSSFIDALDRLNIGARAARFADFPQLIKLIDAEDNLSVQVHPSDEYALAHEGQFGKTEMWYILDAKEGAGIYYGFKDTITREAFEESIRNNTLTERLCFVPVKKGESYFIPAGTIHAIGKGLRIAEIQQNSNVTYRVYDYGRRDAAGNTRPLHVEKALAVTTLAPAKVEFEQTKTTGHGFTATALADCDYFRVEHLQADGTYILQTAHSFTAVLVLGGCGSINGEVFGKYDTFFVPADCGEITLSGTFEALLSRI